MAKLIMLDEIHVRLFGPVGLPEQRYTAMDRTIVGKRFLVGLSRAIHGFVRRFPHLQPIRVILKR